MYGEILAPSRKVLKDLAIDQQLFADRIVQREFFILQQAIDRSHLGLAEPDTVSLSQLPNQLCQSEIIAYFD